MYENKLKANAKESQIKELQEQVAAMGGAIPPQPPSPTHESPDAADPPSQAVEATSPTRALSPTPPATRGMSPGRSPGHSMLAEGGTGAAAGSAVGVGGGSSGDGNEAELRNKIIMARSECF